MSCLHVTRAGVLAIDQRCPETSLVIAIGRRRDLEKLLILGRQAYDNTTWLCPGVPEAADEGRALRAVHRFQRLCEYRLDGGEGYPWTEADIAEAKADMVANLQACAADARAKAEATSP